MPFYLRQSNVLPQVAGLRSVLLVPCRFCPAASLAVKEKKPYIELFRRFLRTGAYESHIRTLKRRLEDRGIKTAVFDSKLPHQFTACMWTSRRRGALARRAAGFEGAVVLGCDAMAESVSESVAPTGCRVVQGMEIEGLMNVLPTVSFPLDISLELTGMAALGAKKKGESDAA